MSDPSRPAGFQERYRLYEDESGDHVYGATDEVPHRFLALLGCWFQNADYLPFHDALEDLKRRHFHHHPDNPVILHREDIINKRKAFRILQDENKCAKFDSDLLEVIQAADFRVVVVVIDKKGMRDNFGESAGHPYHIGLGFLLQRYAGYLNHINRVGDMMAEARGGTEDRLLKDSYNLIYERGVWGITTREFFQSALTSRQLKLQQKRTNISGLQLADIIAHPAKMWVLGQYGFSDKPLAPFADRLMNIIEKKFNRHLYDGRIEGYGYVLYPNK